MMKADALLLLFDERGAPVRPDLDGIAACPIGCPRVALRFAKGGKILYHDHRQLHPASLKCFWSEKELPDNIRITIHIPGGACAH